MERAIGMSGGLGVRKIATPIDKKYVRRNRLRWGYFWGWLTVTLAKLFTKLTSIPTITSELRGRVRRTDGSWLDLGVLGRRVVTDAGVAFLVDDWDDDSQDITDMNYHGCGTDNTAENASDTALGAECTTVLNPNDTRARSQGQ